MKGMQRTTRSLASEGFRSNDIARRVRGRELFPIRRGVYAEEPLEGTAVDRHRRLVLATLTQIDPTSVVSHVSAAVLHGLPVWGSALDRVHVTRESATQSWRSRHLHVHPGAFEADEVALVAGVRATSRLRTVLDVMMTRPLEEAVAVADVVAGEGIDPDLLLVGLEGLGRRRGIGGAKAAARLADGRAETPGESYSRVTLHRAGIPAPQLQVEVFCPRTGLFIARPDFLWEDERVVGEFDGAVKYAGTYGAPEEVVLQEKRRERDLRTAGWGVLRWTWADLAEPQRLRDVWDAEVARRR
ncbi:hypothetical protein GCM10027418_15690 [Mariniluteicoccus endophyticus]